MRIRLFLLISALAFFFDQLTKFLVQKTIPLYHTQPIIGDFFRITLLKNPGGIFGIRIFSDISYYLMPLIGIVIVIIFALRTKNFFYLTAYALILGGAIGNLWDRIRTGSVVDFIDIGIKNLRWYTFNLADAYIVVGILMILGAEIFGPKPRSETPNKPNSN
ncbi:MAG: signal peptidase II [candidate division WOR-3 bacterium]